MKFLKLVNFVISRALNATGQHLFIALNVQVIEDILKINNVSHHVMMEHILMKILVVAFRKFE